MQMKLVIENFDEDLSGISIESSSSISSWIIDYYFTEIFAKQMQMNNRAVQPKNIIGSYDMWMICRTIQPGLSEEEFWNLCKNKLTEMSKEDLMENYDKYLNRCGLSDIIDLVHQCQFNSFMETIVFSIKNMKNTMDRFIFEYLLQLPSTSCAIYDTKTKLTTIETPENLLKFIDNQKPIIEESTNSKNDLKHTLCTHLSLLLDTRNEHALIHCLLTPERVGLNREILVELQCASHNESLTIYQTLLSFVRQKELTTTTTRISSLPHTNDPILEKSYENIKEFFHFIEQLQMIIEENECSSETFRKLLQLIWKHLQSNSSFNHDDSITEEFCQSFQTMISLLNCTSPIRSASSGATLAGRRFLRSLAYLCAKQSIDLPIRNVPPPSKKCRFVSRIRKYRSLDLSIVHERSFESDSIIEDKLPSKTIVQRQPLREIDVNSFSIEDERNRSHKPVVFTLLSEGDKENHPMISRKRAMISTKNDLSTKKPRKTMVKPPEVGQQMITSFFQSTS